MSFSDDVETTVRVLLAVLVIVLLAVVVRLAGPGIEGRVWPIIIYAHRENISRNGNRLCWSTTMEKGRDGFPERGAYSIDYDVDVPSVGPTPARTVHVSDTLSVSLAKNGVPLSVPRFAYHPPHVRWLTEYCANLPDAVAGKAFTIQGTLFFSGANPLWLVPQPLPTIEVAADG